jgi:hypothetical protein
VWEVIFDAFLKDTDINVRVRGLFRQEICSLERPTFMTASTELGHPSGPCAGLPTRGGAGLNNGTR